MKQFKLCSECGTPFEYDDADEDLGVCGECNPFDPDMIGIYETEDEK